MALRILIVEDDNHVLDTLIELTNILGHEVRACTRGSIALELIKLNQYDVLITDYRLPGMSGDGRPADLPEGISWLQKPFNVETYATLLSQFSEGDELWRSKFRKNYFGSKVPVLFDETY